MSQAGRALSAAAGSTALALVLAVPLPHRVSTALEPPAAVDGIVLVPVLALATTAALTLAVGCWALVLSISVRATGRRAVALERAATALTPSLLRRVVAAGVGVGLGLAGTSAATAVETDLGWQPTVATEDATGAETGAPAPSREGLVPMAGTTSAQPPVGGVPVSTSSPASPGPGAMPAEVRETEVVTVEPGDTLWSLAAERLGEDVSDAQVSAAWPHWHETNRDVIGADPDLLLPGQVLTVPSGAASSGAVSADASVVAEADR